MKQYRYHIGKIRGTLKWMILAAGTVGCLFLIITSSSWNKKIFTKDLMGTDSKLPQTTGLQITDMETPTSAAEEYKPPRDDLRTRASPRWYDDAKFGIFIHWGIFAVPAFGDEWFWQRWKTSEAKPYVEYMRNYFKPGFKYPDFVPQFTAQYFDANEWADLIKDSGAKYVVFTSKHHEGFTNWPSKNSFGWNSVDAGPGRDLVGELAQAVTKKSDVRFGIYYSLYEWFNPLYVEDKANNFTTQKFVKAKVMPDLFDLVSTYKPDVLWSDGDWEAPGSYWDTTNFLSWLYNQSPVKDTVVTNDRWGKDLTGHIGDYMSGADRLNPKKLLKRKFENCMTIDRKSWGYRKHAHLSEYFTIEGLIKTLVETVSCGGNLLMNIGPTAEGLITPINEERLRQMGSWLKVNGEAIFATKPWTRQRDPTSGAVWYTTKKNSDRPIVYAIILSWPRGSVLHLKAPKLKPEATVTMLGVQNKVKWKTNRDNTTIELPVFAPNEMPCKWAWVLKFEY